MTDKIIEERQYNIIRNFTSKLEKMGDKLSSLKEQMIDNEKYLFKMQDKRIEVREQIKVLIDTYDILRSNLKIIKKQIKDLEHRKKDLETDIKFLFLVIEFHRPSNPIDYILKSVHQ